MSDDRAELSARLASQDWIDDPTVGFADPEAFTRESLVNPGADWLAVKRTGVISSTEIEVWEYEYERAAGNPSTVPVAFVWDLTNEDLRARVYYNKTHFGLREPRRPILAPTRSTIPSELERYRAAITSGDRALLEAVTSPDAVFQSPIGPVTAAQFITAFSSPTTGGPGVPLEFCSVTQNEHSYAVEFISWRRPPHGGLGVYNFGDGRLESVRVYEGPTYR